MKLRSFLCVLALLAACGQPAPKQERPATPTQAPAAKTEPAPPPRLDHETVIGTWSFDGSCASGDGMGISADGSAFYDEWGTGSWRINPQNQLVLDLMRREMGVEDDPGEPLTLTIDVRGASEEALELEIRGDDTPRVVTALRCS